MLNFCQLSINNRMACLICGGPSFGGRGKGKKKGPLPIATLLDDGAAVIFLLTNLLELPDNSSLELGALLKERGHPFEWASICRKGDCGSLVEEGKDLFGKIQTLQKQFDDVRSRIRRKMISIKTEEDDEFRGMIRNIIRTNGNNVNRDYPDLKQEAESGDEDEGDCFSDLGIDPDSDQDQQDNLLQDQYVPPENDEDEYNTDSISSNNDDSDEDWQEEEYHKKPSVITRRCRRKRRQQFQKEQDVSSAKRDDYPMDDSAPSEENTEVGDVSEGSGSDEETKTSGPGPEVDETHCGLLRGNMRRTHSAAFRFRTIVKPGSVGQSRCRNCGVPCSEKRKTLIKKNLRFRILCEKCVVTFSWETDYSSEEKTLSAILQVAGVKIPDSGKLKKHDEERLFFLSKKRSVQSFPCIKCAKDLSSFVSWRNHLFHCLGGVKGHVCPHCEMSVGSPHALDGHVMSRHLPKEDLQCQGCHVFFKPNILHASSYRKHISALQKSDPRSPCVLSSIMCGEERCTGVFPTTNAFESHKLIRHPKEIRTPFTCPKCPASFPHICSLRIHLQRTHRTVEKVTEKNFICDKCGNAFTEDVLLKCHIKRVHGPKNSICAVCGKAFPTNHKLRRHLKSHNRTE